MNSALFARVAIAVAFFINFSNTSLNANESVRIIPETAELKSHGQGEAHDDIVLQPTQTQYVSFMGSAATVLVENRCCHIFNPVRAMDEEGRTLIGQGGSGSGIIFEINKDRGLIVTNRHVIDSEPLEAQKLNVFFRTRSDQLAKLPAKLIYKHSLVDFAILEFNPKELPEDVILGVAKRPTEEELQILMAPGRTIVVVGNPLRERYWTSRGVISSPSSVHQPLSFGMDAPINPGNSGGPVFDETTGLLLGMSTSKLTSGDGMGYAVPVYIMEQLFQQYKNGDKDDFLGFVDLGAQEVTLNIFSKHGLDEKIKKKMPKMFETFKETIVFADPAEESHLKSGDYLLAVDGQMIGPQVDLLYTMILSWSNPEIKMTVLRGNEIVDVMVPLTNIRPDLKKRESEFMLLNGLFIQDILPVQRHDKSIKGGVVVTEIVHDSFAQSLFSKGLVNRGTLIAAVRLRSGEEPTPIKNLDHLKSLIQSVAVGKSIELFVRQQALQVIPGIWSMQNVWSQSMKVISIAVDDLFTDKTFSIASLKESLPLPNPNPQLLDWRRVAKVDCRSKVSHLTSSPKPPADDRIEWHI